MTTARQPQPVMAYFGHHKCGSTFVNIVICEIGRVLGHKVCVQYLPSVLPLGYHLKEPHASRLNEHYAHAELGDYEILCHGNADQRLLEALKTRKYRAFHVIRDPRDIVVSGYFSHRFSHPADEDFNPWLLDHRNELKKLGNENDGLLCEVEFCETDFVRLADWDYNNPKVLEMKFETLTNNPLDEYKRVLNFLGFEIRSFAPLVTASLLASTAKRKLTGSMNSQYKVCPELVLKRIVRLTSFEKMAGGRKKGAENKKAHFRKGVAGDWKNYFTPEVKAAFKSKYPNLLVKLGYETNNDW